MVKHLSQQEIKINNFKSIFDFKPDDIEIIDYKYGEKLAMRWLFNGKEIL